jgi:hypothetical protein
MGLEIIQIGLLVIAIVLLSAILWSLTRQTSEFRRVFLLETEKTQKSLEKIDESVNRLISTNAQIGRTVKISTSDFLYALERKLIESQRQNQTTKKRSSPTKK